jgi:hypothetical protein
MALLKPLQVDDANGLHQNLLVHIGILPKNLDRYRLILGDLQLYLAGPLKIKFVLLQDFAFHADLSEKSPSHVYF